MSVPTRKAAISPKTTAKSRRLKTLLFDKRTRFERWSMTVVRLRLRRKSATQNRIRFIAGKYQRDMAVLFIPCIWIAWSTGTERNRRARESPRQSKPG
jgi:hypothetical protein